MAFRRNPSEEDYGEFFNRYYDLNDRMGEFEEK